MADKTLLLFSTFAHMQWQVDELARRCTGVDEAVRAAFEETGRWNPDQVIRKWRKRNQSSLHEMRDKSWFNEESWYALVLSTRLNDQSRPLFFEFYSKRELSEEGRHGEFVATYMRVKRLRDFLAHNMAMKALAEERLSVVWFHDSAFGRWMEEDKTRLNLTFMTEAVEVADWLSDVAAWTMWRLGWNGNAKIEDSKGGVFSEEHAPPLSPPHQLGVPTDDEEEEEEEDR